MYGYIYMTINILNGKRYIGQKKSNKFLTKYEYVGSGKLLWKSINKYGIDNFAKELLDTANSKEELDKKEIYWIEYYNAVDSDMFYNIANGGYGGDTISNLSDSDYNCYVNKLRDKTTNNWKNKDFRDRMSNIHKNLWNNDEYRLRMTSILTNSCKNNLPHYTGENHPMYGRKGENSPNYGKKHSEHTRNKMSNSQKGHEVTNDTRNKLSEFNKGRKFINNGLISKSVNQYELSNYLNRGWKLGRLPNRRKR